MKTLCVLLAIIGLGAASDLQARDHHRHHRDKHSHRHYRGHYDHHRDSHRGHYGHHRHHHGRHVHFHRGPHRGPSYRCDGGFMVWIPNIGYMFHTPHQYRHYHR